MRFCFYQILNRGRVTRCIQVSNVNANQQSFEPYIMISSGMGHPVFIVLTSPLSLLGRKVPELTSGNEI